jgi:hypothetical protein
MFSDMLGVQRTSVTLAAAPLQKVEQSDTGVVNIHLLEQSSCECYAAVRRSYDRTRVDFTNARRRQLVSH